MHGSIALLAGALRLTLPCSVTVQDCEQVMAWGFHETQSRLLHALALLAWNHDSADGMQGLPPLSISSLSSARRRSDALGGARQLPRDSTPPPQPAIRALVGGVLGDGRRPAILGLDPTRLPALGEPRLSGRKQ